MFAIPSLGILSLFGIVIGLVVIYTGFRRWRMGAVSFLDGTPGILSGGHISKKQR